MGFKLTFLERLMESLISKQLTLKAPITHLQLFHFSQSFCSKGYSTAKVSCINGRITPEI